MNSVKRNGGQILISCLAANGTDLIYGLPGESALPIFDALIEDAPRFITCRHEANACHMAEADGKMTGRPGICIVSRGPGAMHAAIGVHTAWQNSTPLILIIGQVPGSHLGREAFQEMDFKSLFASTTKWACEIQGAAQIPEYVSRAFHIATEGRPGPVVISIPEDVLSEESDVVDCVPFAKSRCVPAEDSIQELCMLLAAAERPLLVVGGGGWAADTCIRFREFVEAHSLPVVAGFRAQDIIDNRSPSYVGDMSLGGSRKLVARMQQADLLVVIGERLGDVTTRGYTAISMDRRQQKLVHVFPGAEELGRVYPTSISIRALADDFVTALLGHPLKTGNWLQWHQQCRAEFLDHHMRWPQINDGVDLAQVIKTMRDILPSDAIVTNGAGNCNIWLHRFFSYHERGTQIASQAGAMGYGLSAAIAAKIRHPNRLVVGFAGDGCFHMASPDFATAVHHKVPLVVIIANNATYGSIRMHQERHFPGRPSGTALTNPNYAIFAQAHGCFGEVVYKTSEFGEIFRRALAQGGPSLIELQISPGQLTPDMKLG